MLKNTYSKILTTIVVSVICITLHVSGIPGSMWQALVDFVSGPDTIEYTTYSDMPLDLVHKTTFYGRGVDEEGNKVNYNFKVNPNKDTINPELPIFVSDYTPYQDTYENKDVIGYYSLAFVADEKMIENIGESINNKSSYGTWIINFGDILDGFLEGKTYKEVCNGPDRQIQIKAVYNSEDDIAYKLLESQILYELTGNALQTEEDFAENSETINNIIDKIGKYTGNFDKDTIYIVCEQSQAFSQLRSSGKPCYEYSMACSPFYMLSNGDKWKESIERMTSDSHGRVWNVSYSAGLRTPIDGRHSDAITNNGRYRNIYSLDTVLKILRSTG